uniref:Uncharacterized protein n=1 Tax=Cannabis sativa TaxID=3483 RepID=A0A803QS53_CANSA
MVMSLDMEFLGLSTKADATVGDPVFVPARFRGGRWRDREMSRATRKEVGDIFSAPKSKEQTVGVHCGPDVRKEGVDVGQTRLLGRLVDNICSETETSGRGYVQSHLGAKMVFRWVPVPRAHRLVGEYSIIELPWAWEPEVYQILRIWGGSKRNPIFLFFMKSFCVKRNFERLFVKLAFDGLFLELMPEGRREFGLRLKNDSSPNTWLFFNSCWLIKIS